MSEEFTDLHDASHRLITPLNHILGMAQMLWISELDAEQLECVEVIIDASIELDRQLKKELQLRMDAKL